METVSVADAKRRFSELIDRVQQGERFVVSRRGKPVVGLVRPEEIRRRPGGRPRGALALVGALADVDRFHELMLEIVRSRRESRDRPVPDIDID